jgi:hypothetical protein
MLAMDRHSSLLRQLVNYGEKKFYNIGPRARQNYCRLLIDNPSGLFQIDVSYYVDNSDVLLILHVPVAPTSPTLRLIKFHPFPLPFSSSHFLLPQPSNNILAIYNGMEYLTAELSDAKLQDCRKIGTTHYCERHGVLQRGLNASCLGSLYFHNYDSVLRLCNVKIVPQVETVLQTQPNSYLVYLPEHFAGDLSCLNKTYTFFGSVRRGTSEVQVSPSCQLQLPKHKIFSTPSTNSNNLINGYEWMNNDVPLSDEAISAIEEVVKAREAEGTRTHTLVDIQNILSVQKQEQPPIWNWVYALLAALAVLAAIVVSLLGCIIYSSCNTNKRIYSRTAVSESLATTSTSSAIVQNTALANPAATSQNIPLINRLV